LERGVAGDRSALPAIKAAFDEHPELVAHFGDLSARALEALLDLAAGNDQVTREAIRRHAAALRGEIAGGDPSPLLGLLADRVSLTWIDTHTADLNLAAQARLHPSDPQFIQVACRRADSAQRRFLAAVRAAATVTKLLPRKPTALELLTRPIPERAPPRRARKPDDRITSSVSGTDRRAMPVGIAN
jgi:hypothetical protein